MDFFNQSWFWMGVFTATASLGGILIKEQISSRTQLKIERLKLYEADLFKAYNHLYEFVELSFKYLCPPNNAIDDFSDLIGSTAFKIVKKNTLYYNAKIRKNIIVLESQYICLQNSDLIPDKPFDDFFRNDCSNVLSGLKRDILIEIDSIVH